MLRALAGLAALAYLLASLYALFALWMHIGFCDTAEQDCALPWTRTRVALWVGWTVLGLVVLTSAALALAGIVSSAATAASPQLRVLREPIPRGGA